MTDRDQFAAAALTGIVAAGWKNVSDEEAVSWACRLADLMIQKRDAEKMEPPRASSELADRITDYLANGGMFNPEYMEHEKVRRLLMDCRDEIEQSQLTYEERRWLEWAIEVSDSLAECGGAGLAPGEANQTSAALRGLLERRKK